MYSTAQAALYLSEIVGNGSVLFSFLLYNLLAVVFILICYIFKTKFGMLKLSCFTYNYFSNKTQVMCIIILALQFLLENILFCLQYLTNILR